MEPRYVAAGLAGLVVVWSLLLQYVLTPEGAAPPFIFVPILVAWGFAIVLLLTKPRPGAIFTAILGVASAFGALQSHGSPLAWENVVLAALSLAAGAVAGFTVWRRGAQFALG